MLAKSNINSASAPTPSSSLRYPNVAYQNNSDYVKFKFYDYTAPFSTQGQAAAGGNLFGGIGAYNASSSAAGLKATGAEVFLYMPEDIEGEYGANWQDTNLSNVAKGALGTFGGAAGGDLGKSLQSAAGMVKEVTDNFISEGTGVANIISSALQQSNFGSVSVNDVFSVTTGQILNPNTEILYKGPKMRNFSLSFKMAPKNDAEAVIIKNIIRTFKYATLPKYGGAGTDKSASFVRVPQIVDVTFMTGGQENPWVTQFKPCVISGLNISYTPDGAWATYTDGSPVATTMRISFQETKMVYADELSANGATF